MRIRKFLGLIKKVSDTNEKGVDSQIEWREGENLCFEELKYTSTPLRCIECISKREKIEKL